MGYDSSVYGEITIEPPLNWKEYKTAGYFCQSDDGGLRSEWLTLVLDIEHTEIDDGTITRKRASSVVPRVEGPMSRADEGIRGNLQSLIENFGKAHKFSGWIQRQGERQGDVQRYRISDDGTAITSEKAIMLWPTEEIVRVEF
jgi:hypothetical protein